MTALSERRFNLAGSRVAVTFDQLPDGGPLRMSLQGPEAETPDVFERVTQFQPSPDQLAAYAGAYVSEEIDPVYRIAVENGGLVLKRLKSKPRKLDPVLEDYFQGPNSCYHFQIDSAGKITGIILYSGRIKNFCFRKTVQM